VKGILSGHGSLFIGTKGMIATVERGEGVWLLPAARWRNTCSAALADSLARPHGRLDSRLQRRRPFVFGFQRLRALRRMAGAGEPRPARAGQARMDSQRVRFTNSDEANKFVRPLFRKGWELKL